MLCHLTIQNFTLVDDLDIEFSRGMTVVTGETGTGKSIMLDALSLTLGSRADNAMIAIGAARAEIHATFDISDNEQALTWLADRDLANDATCILRRIINRDGRSRAFINGVPSTLTDLGAIGVLLADIHSQHEHQSLLKPETHRRLLDEFGSLTSCAADVTELYTQHRTRQNELNAMLEDSQDSSRLQLLTYQAGELIELGLADGETEQLEQEQKRLASAEEILNSCQRVIELCTDDDNANIHTMLSRAVEYLSAMDDDAIQPILELLSSSQIQVEEAMTDLKSLSGQYNVDPSRLMEVESRLSAIYDIARKHRVNPNELPVLAESIQKEVDALANVDDHLQALESELRHLEKAYRAAADELSIQRELAAGNLQNAVTDRLADLGMAGATFSVRCNSRRDDTLHANGNEDAEFLISTNVNQPARALARIASGGELSRISLAIQVVTADTSRVPTLVFDEVDVGIGGGIAEVVGTQLRGLGDKGQIICVTHLPQVAAQGHHHLLVAKVPGPVTASITVDFLDEDLKVEEIARMLGGIETTDQSLAHAREMFGAAQEGAAQEGAAQDVQREKL